MKLRTGCALLGLLAVGGVLYGVRQAQTPPSVGTSVPFKQLPAQEQQQKRVEAKRLEEQVEEIARSARNKEKKPFSLVVTADQLNTLLADRLDTSKFPLRDPRIGMEPERLLLQGNVLYKGFEAVVTLTGNVVAQNGDLVFQTENLQIGGLPAPGEWKEKAQREITKQLNSAVKKAPGRIERVQLEQDTMTISGVTD
jgi:hypothetical protein